MIERVGACYQLVELRGLSGGKKQLGVGRRADAAGCLQPGGGGGLGETADDIGPDPASAGAVQVDEVNQSCPRGCESP